jgi:hypothetical protein
MFEIKEGTRETVLGTGTKYPFHLMRPQTYIEIPAGHPLAQKNRWGNAKAQIDAIAYARRMGIKMTTATRSDGSVLVFRE